MKIVVACQNPYPFCSRYGGESKYIYYLSKYLVKRGVEVEIVASLDNGKRRTEIYDGIRYTLIPPSFKPRAFLMEPFLRSLLLSINVAGYLKGKDFDVLHGYFVIPYAYLHLKKRAPVLYQPFGNEGLTVAKMLKRTILLKIYDRFLMKPLYRYCGRHSEAIAAEGDFQVAEMAQLYGIDVNRVFVLPVGVDCSFIKERLRVKAVLRSDLGLTENDFVLISVNMLSLVKGINYLIDAFHIVKQKLTNAKLLLIGTGNEEKRIEAQINNYCMKDSVIHLRDVSEDTLYDYYAISDLYVSPTLQKDFIMGILEAEVCGLPIVSTGQEWLIKEGVNGYVVPQKDPQALAEGITKVYEGNGKAMGMASQEIAKDYDFEHLAELAVKIYQRLAIKTHL